jgi:hypothetical protein
MKCFDLREIDRCESGAPIRRRERRIRHEMHDDAARKPHREQQTERHAQSKMRKDKHADHDRALPLG